MKTYAYVTSETCCHTCAKLPGHIGRNGKPISRNGDYVRWGWGKRATLAMIDSAGGYQHWAASAVAWLLGWSDER